MSSTYLFSGFSDNNNNANNSDKIMKEVEDNIVEEQMTFASSAEPTETTGAFQNESQFVFSILKGKKPTLLFRNGDFMNGYKINLIDLFPLNFPFGWGGPNKKRID